MSIKLFAQKILKISFIVVTIVVHIFLFAGVNYLFPHYEITVVTGSEVKRVDKDGPISKSNPADGPVRDVYYIFTENPNKDNSVMVYRNEDTRWGFPFYFKFNSADTQARAIAFATERKQVQIKHYGWRLVLFNEFRNIVSIKEAAADETVSRPIASYVAYLLLLLSFFLSIQFIRGWFK